MPKPSKDPIGVKSIEWAAGLFEGEGWLYQKKDKPHLWQLGVRMTDKDVLESIHAIMGVGYLRGPFKGAKDHYKNNYTWRVYTTADIFKVICEFYPYMGERRRAKFDEFLTTYGN